MSPLLLFRSRVRVLSITTVCLLLVSLSLVWARLQLASSPTFKSARNHASVNLFVADKGGITPKATTITVNSLSDVANASDGLCTLREATAISSDVVISARSR